MSAQEALIHIYNAPPKVGDEALCGYVRQDAIEGHRLIRSDNQCEVCAAIAGGEGRTLVSRPALDPQVWVRDA
jgi:hypothetical protein